MLWFKHMARSTSDPDLVEAILKFGANGYYVFFNTLEILAREGALDKDLVIDMKVFSSFFPKISERKLTAILLFFDKKNRFKLHLNDKKLSLCCQKLSIISMTYRGIGKIRGDFLQTQKEEGRRKKEEGRRKKIEGRRKTSPSERGRRPARPERTIPSLKQIKEFASERKSKVDPEKFFDYYEASKWHSSKGVKVRDWKACFRYWEKTEMLRQQTKRSKFGPQKVTKEFLKDQAKEFERRHKDD